MNSKSKNEKNEKEKEFGKWILYIILNNYKKMLNAIKMIVKKVQLIIFFTNQIKYNLMLNY